MSLTLHTVLTATGGNTTGIEIPAEVVASFGRGRRVPVVVTIGDHAFRNTIAAYRDSYWLGVSAENRTRAGIAAGDAIDVTLEVDDAPRTVEPPAELADALADDPAAAAAWDTLSYSHQRAHAEAIAEAKRPDTRARRVAAALKMLHATP